jgi:hypothetical protein
MTVESRLEVGVDGWLDTAILANGDSQRVDRLNNPEVGIPADSPRRETWVLDL